jgi:hypothetical protein
MTQPAPTDYAYLDGLRRYEDPSTGISEEFVPPSLGPGGAWGVLSLPLGRQRALGWVICSSLGKERSFLRRLEAVVARRLAEAGFPVLRLRGGSDNGSPPRREISLGARLAEAEGAVAVLADRTHVPGVAAFGALGGGLVAMLTANRLRLSALAVVEPVVKGRRYMREALRMEALSDLVAGGEGGAGVAGQAHAELADAGHTTIRGFVLRREDHDEISAADLETATEFAGKLLVVGVSPTAEPSPSLQRLHESCAARGVDSTLRILQDPLVVPFGESYLRDVGTVRRDTRLELDRAIAGTIVDWATSNGAESVPPAALA